MKGKRERGGRKPLRSLIKKRVSSDDLIMSQATIRLATGCHLPKRALCVCSSVFTYFDLISLFLSFFAPSSWENR